MPFLRHVGLMLVAAAAIREAMISQLQTVMALQQSRSFTSIRHSRYRLLPLRLLRRQRTMYTSRNTSSCSMEPSCYSNIKQGTYFGRCEFSAAMRHLSVVSAHKLKSTKIKMDQQRFDNEIDDASIIRDTDKLLQQPLQANNNHDRNRTMYTIDFCPPTHPDKLKEIVQKYIDTLPQYLLHRPVVSHTQTAFTELQKQLLQQNLLDIDTTTTTVDTTTTTSTNLPKKPIVLDSGCGTARSTIRLGRLYPEAIVLGLDRSLKRLTKNEYVTKGHTTRENLILGNNNINNREEERRIVESSQQSNNMVAESYDSSSAIEDDVEDEHDNQVADNIEDYDDPTRLVEQVATNVWLVRCEMIDFWRCMVQHSWHSNVQAHYLLYPNPYPKKSRLQLRLYAHPSFPLCLQLLLNPTNSNCTTTTTAAHPNFEVVERKMVIRSNWKQYLDEFAISAAMILDSQQQQCNDSGDNLVVREVHEMINPTTHVEIAKQAMTNFEQKYWIVGESTYELILSNRP